MRNLISLAQLLLLPCIVSCTIAGPGAAPASALNSATFATIRIDHASKDDVLRILGQPAERSRVMMHNYEVWSYRYREAGVWNSMMHVHFDEKGIVRMMQNGPDPQFEERRPFFH